MNVTVREPNQPRTVYEMVGGMEFFEDLTRRFYLRIEEDEVLRPMHPKDLAVSQRKNALFLAQYWGGPATYSEQRGHPRLRARHMPFPIDKEARDRWFRLMKESVEESEIPEAARTAMVDYFEKASLTMINQGDTATS
ncbi:MAG: globin [Acidimicrobiia bacterium]|nr:globin [Acidimicrobiia bacterium]